MPPSKTIKHCRTCGHPYTGRFCANRDCAQHKKSKAARRASQRNSRSSSRRGHFASYGSFGWGSVSASVSLPNAGPSASNQIVANAGFYTDRVSEAAA